MPRARKHVLTIPGWVPATVNQLLRSVRGRIRLKKADREVVAVYARLSGIPRATGQRRVGLTIVLGRGQRGCDGDAPWKSLLDSLVSAGLLVDDAPAWCELAPVKFRRGERGTEITLTDLEAR
jgi:hypothetical protein